MNPILSLTYNNLPLTQRMAQSALSQDIPTELFIWDNGSRDGTHEWMEANLPASHRWTRDTNWGVSKPWNIAIDGIFNKGAEHILVCGNDTVLPSWFYSSLLSYQTGFVTGVAVDSLDMIAEPAAPMPLTPFPDFSAFLVTYDCWAKIGPFNESMQLYVQDCDMHVRAHRKGISLWKANVPFYHEISSTIRNSPDEERYQLESRADLDRQAFRDAWATIPGEPAYDLLLTPDKFGINKPR